ncbi:DNA gyrase inhibitor YacG [Paracoccus tegillarcae]|uniref:DNA gyrase inhibitor YacG n=1 Tax=Paracoccus tegillarcae TaxID=1529068 RepID=A0A2K9ESZ5_9RHOB|nr:DNA gyrase inhibitor YacG [Paracoccus tegillarcae]AUH32334.1 DNA gyrase inhibitor YacG [Paracoccus tegillarcae]
MAGCPICDKPSVPAYRPFCSRRCADVDLARWLRGDYVIPGPPADRSDDADDDQGRN